LTRAASAALLAATLALPAPAAAWGPTGHRAVGRIAENHLAPETVRALVCLMGAESLAEAANWADEIRTDPADPKHYVSIDDGETYETTAKNPEGDVIQAIGRFEAVLRDPAAPRQARIEALRYVVHFVGDVHQPLHVGRRADLGGNLIEVTWFGGKSNLHSVWDSGMIHHDALSFSELAAFVDHPTQAEIAAWQSAGVLDWARESLGHRAQVYDLGGTSKLSWEYFYRNLPLVKRRLLQAGVRLAGLLNRVFAEQAVPVGGGAPPGGCT
jgi:hypothetical protein